jgi:hypothetical protein
MSINKMGIYEASFLGEPKPIKEKKKKATPAPAPEPVAVEVMPTEPKPKPIRKRKAPEPKVPVDEPVPVVTQKVEKKKAAPKKAAPVKTTEPKEPPIKAVAKKVIISGVEAQDPPPWFKKWDLDEAKRRNNKRPKAEKVTPQILKAATEVESTAKWNDGVTREKVNAEVDSHMSRLYKQIHGRK